jgi:hypothetical protein
VITALKMERFEVNLSLSFFLRATEKAARHYARPEFLPRQQMELAQRVS